MIQPAQLLAFDFAAEEAEVVVQLPDARLVLHARRVPLPRDGPPALLLGLELELAGGGDAHARTRRVVDAGEGLPADGADRGGHLGGGGLGGGLGGGEDGGEGGRGRGLGGDEAGDGHAIAGEVAEGLEPVNLEGVEGALLEEAAVEGVGVVDELLEVFHGDLGGEGEAAEVLEEAVEGVAPEADDNVVFFGDAAEGDGDGGGEGDLEEVVHHLGEAVEEVV